MTTSAADSLPTGLCNLRPVPGVRDGLVLRCDVPRWLTATELAEIGPLATQLDLRATEEAELDGSGLLAEHGVVRHHLPYGYRTTPVTSDEVIDDVVGQYRIFAAMGVGAIIDGFELLTTVELPAIVHCTAGKDRTGVFVAALSLAMGVPRAEVVADFMASEAAQAEAERRFWLLPSTAARTNPVPPGAYPISPELAEAVVGVIEQAGGVAAWLSAAGAAGDLLDRLRARLAE